METKDSKYLAEVRERADKATGGEWLNAYPNAGKLIPMADHVWTSEKGLVAKDLQPGDAEFIAHARTDIPQLLKLIAERDAEIVALKQAERVGTRGPGLMELRKQNDQLRKQLEVARTALKIQWEHIERPMAFQEREWAKKDYEWALAELDRLEKE